MTAREHELRVLVVAPTGRDGPMICDLLAGNGVAGVWSGTSEMARTELNAGAGAIVLAEEVLTLPEIAAWATQIVEQPSWSDLPLLLLTVAGAVSAENRRKSLARQPLGNLVLLERPVRPETLISTVEAALRSRRRQYQVRDFMAERLVAEEALRKVEKLAVAARLAASFSHEINNPLAAVVNLIYIAKNIPSVPDAVVEQLVQAEHELERVAHITRQTLGFYRESGAQEMIAVPALIESALRLYSNKIAAKNIRLERAFERCAPVAGILGELRQAVSNLIANAIDAVEQGGTISVAARTIKGGEGCVVEFIVADDGPGISAEHIERIFEPFFTTKKDVGTGLGLWATKAIIERHSGSISFRPQQEGGAARGAAFAIQLPCASAAPDGEAQQFEDGA